MTEYSFKAKITSRGYHGFKETTCHKVKEGGSVGIDLETNKFSKNFILTHVRSVRKINFLTRRKWWEISRKKYLVMFIILSRQKVVLQMVQLYQVNMVHHLFHLGDLKFRCCLNFRAYHRRCLEKWKTYANSLYGYDYSALNNEESSDEEKATIVIETDQSKWVSHTATDQSKLVSYTGSSNEEEQDLHIDVNFDEPVDLAIN